MNAVRMMLGVMSFNKAFLHCGMSKKMRHSTPKPRNILSNPEVQKMV